MDSLSEHWTRETAHKFIAHSYRRQPDLFFVAEYEDKLVGAIVASVQPWWDGNRLVEGEFFMDPQYQASGIEGKLLRTLLSYARDTYNVVAWDTIMPNIDEHPLGSYEKLGFTEVLHWRAISGDINTLLARLGP